MTREEAKNWSVSEFFDNGYTMREGINLLIDRIYDNHKAQLKSLRNENFAETEMFNKVVKAKDEEIEKLMTVLTQISCQSIVGGFKLGENKARSIVAMLFWELKKRKRLYIANGHRSSNAGWGLYEQANLMEVMFQQAYKILKDNKC